MPDPNFENMTVDGLVEWKVSRKAEVVAIQERMRAAEAVLAGKLEQERIKAALGAAGVDAGRATISPPPAPLGVEGGEVN